MAAPILIAKGADAVAFKIREVAEANKIPIVENPPLARGLFAAVDLDEEIPAEHYKAVAEVIGYVMRLRGPRPCRETRLEPTLPLNFCFRHGQNREPEGALATLSL